jgi:hypothetical protein
MLRRDKTGPFHGQWKHPALKSRLDRNLGWTKSRLDLDFRGAGVYISFWAKTKGEILGR